MPFSNADKMLKYLTLLFFVSIFAIGSIVCAVTFGVMSRTFEATCTEQHTQLLINKKKALEHCLQHLNEQATQLHTCSLCCSKLKACTTEELPLNELLPTCNESLERTLKHSSIIDGIVRIDTQGNVVAKAGSCFERKFWPHIRDMPVPGTPMPATSIYSSLISDSGVLHIIAVSPIQINSRILGYDILTFSSKHFMDFMDDDSVSATAIFQLKNNSSSIWINADNTTTPSAVAQKRSRIEKMLKKLVPYPTADPVHTYQNPLAEQKSFFIYAQITGTTWYIGTMIETTPTFGSMMHEYTAVFITILGLSLSGGILCHMGLRPLTRRIITLGQNLEEANASFIAELSERRQMEASLRLSEEQWVNTFASIEDAIFVLDADGNIIKENSAARKLCSAYTTPACASKLIPQNGKPSDLFNKMVSQGKSIKQTCDDIADASFRITMTPILINGQITGAVHLVRDITDETRGEKMKSEMLAAVSHEIRTPVTAITGFVEFMQSNEVTEEQRQEYLMIIHREMDRMNELMNDFLDLQRLQSSMQEYNYIEADIAALLRESAGLYEMAMNKHKLVLQIPEQLPLIKVDASRMIRVFSNIISNAIKYSPQGGTITIGARSTKKNIFIWIQDEGLGIPPQSQTKIFNRFYRVNDGDRRIAGGLGLGLALVKEIVEAHNGRVWVESKENRGSTFFVELPRS